MFIMFAGFTCFIISAIVTRRKNCIRQNIQIPIVDGFANFRNPRFRKTYDPEQNIYLNVTQIL